MDIENIIIHNEDDFINLGYSIVNRSKSIKNDEKVVVFGYYDKMCDLLQEVLRYDTYVGEIELFDDECLENPREYMMTIDGLGYVDICSAICNDRDYIPYEALVVYIFDDCHSQILGMNDEQNFKVYEINADLLYESDFDVSDDLETCDNVGEIEKCCDNCSCECNCCKNSNNEIFKYDCHDNKYLADDFEYLFDEQIINKIVTLLMLM